MQPKRGRPGVEEFEGEVAVPAGHHPRAGDVDGQADPGQVRHAGDGRREPGPEPQRMRGAAQRQAARCQLELAPVVYRLGVETVNAVLVGQVDDVAGIGERLQRRPEPQQQPVSPQLARPADLSPADLDRDLTCCQHVPPPRDDSHILMFCWTAINVEV